MNQRRNFIRVCFVGVGALFLRAKSLLASGKMKQVETVKKPDFEYVVMYREEWETLDDFIGRVMEWASDKRMYDITYTKMPPFKTGYVVTLRRPTVNFLPDRAVVWWWTGFERFPENVENWKKKK